MCFNLIYKYVGLNGKKYFEDARERKSEKNIF
jgi:hypothetical protein